MAKKGKKLKASLETGPVDALFSGSFSISSPCFCKLWRGLLCSNSNICFAFSYICG